MAAKRKPDSLSELLAHIEKLPSHQRQLLIERLEATKPVQPEPKTPFARKILTLRQKIIAEGLPLLNYADVQRELSERRGSEAL